MGDYAPFQMYVYEIPEGQEQAVLDLIIEHSLHIDWWGKLISLEQLSRAVDEQLQITDDQARMDIVWDLGKDLAQLGVVFDMWQDPKYEFMGAGMRHHPELGSHEYAADAQGGEYIETYRINDLATLEPDRFKDAVLTLTDRDKAARFRELIKNAE